MRRSMRLKLRCWRDLTLNKLTLGVHHRRLATGVLQAWRSAAEARQQTVRLYLAYRLKWTQRLSLAAWKAVTDG